MKMKITTLLVLFLFLFRFSYCQTIYEKGAEHKKGANTAYEKFEIATSNAFAYKHKNYTPASFRKIIYFINTDDEKTIKTIEKEFAEVGILAKNMLDLYCEECEDPEKFKQFVIENKFEAILQISMTSERKAGTTFVTNYYQTVLGATSYSTMKTWKGVFMVFEWYNEQFEVEPFLVTQVYKGSQTGIPGKYYSLVEGDIILSIRRPIKYGLLIKNKRIK